MLKRFILMGVSAVTLLSYGLFPAQIAAAPNSPKVSGTRFASKHIAIVIDDFGNGMKGSEEMLNLPVKFTVAIMPFLPATQHDAEAAHARGHDVIVHLPMEPIRGKASWLGPGAILTSLSDEEIRSRVEAAIADVPYAIGMNNHMGSRATADERIMRIVLQACKEKGLFFLDSRTSWRTVVPKIARELGVPVLQNDVFLDDVYTRRHVSRQIALLRKELQNRDTCVAIGHVGPPGLITSATLKSAIPELQSEASFVRLSELVPAANRAQGSRKR